LLFNSNSNSRAVLSKSASLFLYFPLFAPPLPLSAHSILLSYTVSSPFPYALYPPLWLEVWGGALKLQLRTGKCKYGRVKYKVAKCVLVENTSTENSSTATQGWKTQVWKMEVPVSRVGKCKYGKIEYGITVVTFFDND